MLVDTVQNVKEMAFPSLNLFPGRIPPQSPSSQPSGVKYLPTLLAYCCDSCIFFDNWMSSVSCLYLAENFRAQLGG